VRATRAGATEQALRAVPGADSIEVRGDTVFIHSGDADKVARYLLTETGAHDLEITSRGLEEAFLALTGDDTNTGGHQ
jgi:ABC-2 type transport system ATP-binding protein